MVAPITPRPNKPTVEYYGSNGVGFNFPIYQQIFITSYRQAKPFNLALPYYTISLHIPTWSSTRPDDWPNIGSYLNRDTYLDAIASNKALSELKDELQKSSMWAVNVAEYQQAFDLITKSASVLTKTVKNLKRLKLKQTSKDLSDLWLRFHFGVEPLAQDIYNAVSVLQKAVPNRMIYSKATYEMPASTYWLTGGPAYGDKITDSYKVRVRLMAEVHCESPNLYLANQLGVVNPASFAWEIIPFSFVVDWFANVGQFLDSFSMWAGLNVVQSSTTHLVTTSKKWDRLSPSFFMTSTVNGMWFQRAQGLPPVVLQIAPWKAPSPVRAATAIALLVQQLR